MSQTPRPPKRFAPLDPHRSGVAGAPVLKGVVFDVDGTLCAALSIDKSTDILDHIYSLPHPAQEQAQAAIRAIESSAMVEQEPQPGLNELIAYLESRGVRMGLCTRNFDGPVMHLLQKFLPGKTFAPIVTREFRPPKPDPAGILHIAKAWGLDDGGEGLIMVGDSIDDMTAGHKAGTATVLLANEGNGDLKEHGHTGRWIERLDELIGILESGFEEIRGRE
ncbi:hypothetical protein IMSHALPRED_009534 [Imshaugia aleurites]|uniref:Phosphoglycolate phosphatase n=1 Tax=Imshaugia aleurites TaxID=172621 RepID=A0A8H3IYG2_9LECA|nr:hypothetical protein IMSHALPRED_009534 [Imshaugia aleurites]